MCELGLGRPAAVTEPQPAVAQRGVAQRDRERLGEGIDRRDR